MRQLLIVCLSACFIAGCSPKLTADRYWTDRRWVLNELKGVPVQLSGTNRDAYLEFNYDEKRIRGNGGCNGINGSYELKRNDLKFINVSSTKMACSDLAFENTFLETLATVDGYEVEDDLLVMKDGRKTVLIFKSR